MSGNGAGDVDLTQVFRRGTHLRRSAQWNVAHLLDDQQFTPGAQSLHRGLMLLDVVAVTARDEPGGVSLAVLARITGLPKSSLHRLLLALTEAGYVERVDPGGTYKLGVQAQILGELAVSAHDALHDAAGDSMIRLADLSGDTALLTVRRGSYGLCVRREEGPGEIRNNALAVGDRHPLGVGAGSLAMLAALPDDEVEELLERNAHIIDRHYPLLPSGTLRTLVTQTRQDGYATNPGLGAPGSWAIAVAIRDRGGAPVAALSIASIEQRLSGPRRGELVRALHTEVERITDVVFGDATASTDTRRPNGRPHR